MRSNYSGHHDYLPVSQSQRSSDSEIKPLFGETRTRDRLMYLIIGGVTSLAVCVTVILAFVGYKRNEHKKVFVDVFFAMCLLMICISNVILIYWYRQGDVDPKFRILIYYNAACIIALCVGANLFFADVGQ